MGPPVTPPLKAGPDPSSVWPTGQIADIINGFVDVGQRRVAVFFWPTRSFP
jgi:hypothetical protein